MLHWLWTCFRQPVEPRCNPRVPCVTSLYTGGSSTSPSHPPPFDARPSPNRRGRRKDGPLCHRASHRLLTTDALTTPRRTSVVLCGASPVPRRISGRAGVALVSRRTLTVWVWVWVQGARRRHAHVARAGQFGSVDWLETIASLFQQPACAAHLVEYGPLWDTWATECVGDHCLPRSGFTRAPGELVPLPLTDTALTSLERSSTLSEADGDAGTE